jgi:hypothetical protein
MSIGRRRPAMGFVGVPALEEWKMVIRKHRMFPRLHFLFAAVLAVAGCEDRPIGFVPDATNGPQLDASVSVPMDAAADPGPDAEVRCPEEGYQIYVVTYEKELYRFYPPAKQFDLVSVLDCPSPGRPFSMAISSEAIGYIFYYEPGPPWTCVGINEVNIITGECLGLTGFDCQNPEGFDIFTVGYATDATDTTRETLYIAGGWQNDHPRLASLDTEHWTVNPIATLPTYSAPEMTKDAQGELWGFFGWGDPFLARIGRTTAGLTGFIRLPHLSGTDHSIAAAYWGGNFYVFWSTADGGDVYQVPSNTVSVYTSFDFEVMGANVSICRR